MARMIRQFALPSTPKLMSADFTEIFNGGEAKGKAIDNKPEGSSTDAASTSSGGSGLREMEDTDIPSVKNLWDRSVCECWVISLSI